MARDRHARVRRADGDARRRPADGFRVRDRERFGRLVAEAVGALPAPAADALAGAALVVQDVPADAVGEVPLADAEADGPRIRRLVVYRRPVELRANDRYDLVDLLREALLEAAADALGADPDDWDDT